MNWLLAIKRFLGRFWTDIFQDSDFILGVEYLHFLYSKVTGYQYLNWQNGLIAANLSVAQETLPFVIYIDANEVQREWYKWNVLWDDYSAKRFINHTYASTADKNKMGWTAESKYPVQEPFYLTDHIYNPSVFLLEGLDYEFYNGKFWFHIDPAKVGFKTVKVTEADGLPHVYYEFFGYMRQTSKICDPVTGFESSWLNPFSNIAWDIHQNGATFYNVKQLLGKATDVVICENDGIVNDIWTEQGYNCLLVGDKVYMSSKDPAAGITVGTAVEQGTVLFGKLLMFTGSDAPTSDQIPGVRVMTDVGELIAYNQDMPADRTEPDRVFVLPLRKGAIEEGPYPPYMNKCAENIKNENCPYIQVPPSGVNPYTFITQTIRRGRSVTIRLVAGALDVLGAAINTIRKSCCAAGMVNIYVEASTDTNDMLKTANFSANAGMMAIAVVETFTIKKACAEAKIIL